PLGIGQGLAVTALFGKQFDHSLIGENLVFQVTLAFFVAAGESAAEILDKADRLLKSPRGFIISAQGAIGESGHGERAGEFLYSSHLTGNGGGLFSVAKA